MTVFVFLPLVLIISSSSNGQKPNSPNWAKPQFEMIDHVPGEPLSPIDYQNANLLLNIPPPNTVFHRDPIELAGLFEGDIILTEGDKGHAGVTNFTAEEIGDDSLKNAIVKENLKWPGGVIPYFIAAQFDPMERSTIARAFLEYQRSTCIVFKPRTTETDYIHITKGNGCSSHVGRTGGAQPVILGNGCVYAGIAMHELMHAVGFWHEQSRFDRDDHVTIRYENIQPNMDFNFQKYNWNTIQNLGVAYDTGSILHYGATAFAKDKRYPTIVPKVPNDKMGQRVAFSQNDIMKINRLYHCNGQSAPGTNEPTQVTQKPTTPIESRCLDSHKYCPDWSARGECQKNPTWMLVNCKRSCNRCDSPCSDVNPNCAIWAQMGECVKNSDYMKMYCPVSCASCPADPGVISDPTIECDDQHEHCQAWAARGECALNPKYMLSKCKKACRFCRISPEVAEASEPQFPKTQTKRRGKSAALRKLQKEL